jgi:hypothetical protein
VTGAAAEITIGVLSLAWFAAVNAIVSLLAAIVSSRFEDRPQANAWRARRLLAVRLAPAASSLTLAAALFLPAHAWLEPARADERIGFVPLGLAALGLALLLSGLRRAVGALRATARLAAIAGASTSMPRDGGAPLQEVQGLRGITLAGIVRPRILIGSRARQVLTSAELDLAIAHECAHLRARDNLWRVLVHCAPDCLGWSRQARRLERLWDGEAECLADAAAAAGSRVRATRLAAALVKVARLGAAERALAPRWSHFHHPLLLETRVRLLISEVRLPPAPVNGVRAAAWTIAAILALGAVWIAGIPQQLHWITEALLVRLP